MRKGLKYNMDTVMGRVEVALTPKKMKNVKKTKEENAKEKKDKALALKKAAEQKKETEIKKSSVLKIAKEFKKGVKLIKASELQKATEFRETEIISKTTNDGSKNDTRYCDGKDKQYDVHKGNAKESRNAKHENGANPVSHGINICSSPRKLSKHKVAQQELNNGRNSPVHISWDLSNKDVAVPPARHYVSSSGPQSTYPYPITPQILVRNMPSVHAVNSSSSITHTSSHISQTSLGHRTPISTQSYSKNLICHNMAAQSCSITDRNPDNGARFINERPLTPHHVKPTPKRSYASQNGVNMCMKSTNLMDKCNIRLEDSYMCMTASSSPFLLRPRSITMALPAPAPEPKSISSNATHQEKMDKCFQEKSEKLQERSRIRQYVDNSKEMSRSRRSASTPRSQRSSTSCLSCLSKRGKNLFLIIVE